MNRLLTYLTVACVFLLAGVWVGSKSVVPPVPAPSPTPLPRLQSLTEGELQEYMELKSLRAKYEKADELLGKALMILLEDYGHRLSGEQREYARNAARGIHAEVEESAPSPTFKGPLPSPSPQPVGVTALLAIAPKAKRVQGSPSPGQIAMDRIGGSGRTDAHGNRLGWYKDGRTPEDYEVGFLPELDSYGEQVATIRAIHDGARPFGSLTHVMDAQGFAGKRVLLRALVKAEGARDGGNLYFRADGPHRRQLAYEKSNFRESFDWKMIEVALDVPPETAMLFFGLTLDGRGQAWIKLVSITQSGNP
jgi:hypothetical protein